MNFYEFPIPTEINGEQLKQELNCAEVYIRDNNLIIGGMLTKEEALAGLTNHKPMLAPELTIEDKLASVGLDLEQLKAAILGSN